MLNHDSQHAAATMTDVITASKVREALHRSLAADPKTCDPMNALVVWTELGKGLAGTLEEVGAERGLLRKIIFTHGVDHGAVEDIDLSRWAYRVEGDARLTEAEAAGALQRAEDELEDALPELAAAADADSDGRRALFVAIVKGWYPVGLDIVRSLPAARTASEQMVAGAFVAWCVRYLPESADEPAPHQGPHVSHGHDHGHDHGHGHDHAHDGPAVGQGKLRLRIVS